LDRTLLEQHFSGLKFHDADALDPALFRYTPPEGARVVDMSVTDDETGGNPQEDP